MNPQHEKLAQWAGLECRCIRHDGPKGRTYLRHRCPLHSNGGYPPDYSRDEVAISLLPILANDGYCPTLAFDDDGNWALSFSGVQSFGTTPTLVSAHYDADNWQPTIAQAISKAVLKLIDAANNGE